MLKLRLAAPTAGALFLLLIAGISPASAVPGSCDENGVCTGVITDPGTPPSDGTTPGVSDPIDIGFTPGPTTCTSDRLEEEVPCSTEDGWWNPERQCWVTIAEPQRAAPAGSNPNGAYYRCTPAVPEDEFIVSYEFWSNTPPPGVNVYSPGQAARILISRFQLQPIDIGMAPNAGVRTYIGYNVWMWAANPQPLSFGPYSETATLGGQTITATARVTGVTWNMGDGTSVQCGAGTAYDQPSHGGSASPTCGHVYTEATEAGGAYTVTATSSWAVTWTGGGETGTIYLTRQTSRPVEVGQLQSVNVPNP